MVSVSEPIKLNLLSGIGKNKLFGYIAAGIFCGTVFAMQHRRKSYQDNSISANSVVNSYWISIHGRSS